MLNCEMLTSRKHTVGESADADYVSSSSASSQEIKTKEDDKPGASYFHSSKK